MKKEEHYIQKIKDKTMYQMKKIFFIVIIFLIQLNAKAQEKKEITIESAKAYALNHSKKLKRLN